MVCFEEVSELGNWQKFELAMIFFVYASVCLSIIFGIDCEEEGEGG